MELVYISAGALASLVIVSLLVGTAVGKRIERRRWIRAANALRFPAPAHTQSVRVGGQEFFVLSSRRYQEMSQNATRVELGRHVYREP